jgi:predicted outer membrane protein
MKEVRKMRHVVLCGVLGSVLSLCAISACDDDDDSNVSSDRGSGGSSGSGSGGTYGGAGGAGGSTGGSLGGSGGGSGGSTGSGGSGGSTADAAGDTGTADGGNADAGTVTTEAQVLGVMAEANMGEVMVNGLAVTRVTTASVKTFAQQMVTEHTGALARGTALATRLMVVPADSPVKMNLHMQAMQTRDMLSAITDVPAFERAFVQSQVEMHMMVLTLIDTQLLPVAQTPDLRTELMNMRNTVANHLAEAQSLRTAVGTDGGTDAP